MQRKIYSQLVDWKQSSDCRFCFHKCCLLFYVKFSYFAL